jgi:uncharacterized protein YndB with AHSA1/START domain
MPKDLTATASATVNAPSQKVWDALVTPAIIKKYMFGSTVTSDFRKGSPITFKGEWQGKAYEDKGVILDAQPKRLLAYTHYSPLTGLPDKPENYHTVRIELAPKGDQTSVTLTQDNNANEQERAHSQKNWEMMLESLKTILETA